MRTSRTTFVLTARIALHLNTMSINGQVASLMTSLNCPAFNTPYLFMSPFNLVGEESIAKVSSRLLIKVNPCETYLGFILRGEALDFHWIRNADQVYLIRDCRLDFTTVLLTGLAEKGLYQTA